MRNAQGSRLSYFCCENGRFWFSAKNEVSGLPAADEGAAGDDEPGPGVVAGSDGEPPSGAYVLSETQLAGSLDLIRQEEEKARALSSLHIDKATAP